MKSAVRSKKSAVILGILVGIITALLYSTTYPWLGIIVGPLAGIFTFFILKAKRMEKLRVYFFLGLAVFAVITLTANILYLGIHSFLEWVRIWDTGYFSRGGDAQGTSPFPLPILIPTILLGKAQFQTDSSVWLTSIPTSLDVFLIFMVPYFITFLVFDRAFCGWICPLGGLPETVSNLSKKRRWFLKFLEKKPAAPGGFSLTGLTGLKGWAEWLRYGILAALFLWSVLGGFAIVNIISPALWLKSVPVFWTIVGILVVFAVVLPFMTKRRWWCDVVCPVGSSLALLHRIGFFRIKIDKAKCNECMDCVHECRMYAMTPQGVKMGEPMSGNCIKCGRCIEACPEEAIEIAWLGKYGNVRAAFLTLVITAAISWYLWFAVLLTSYVGKLNNFSIQ